MEYVGERKNANNHNSQSALVHASRTRTHTFALTVSSATKEDDLMATIIAGQRFLKLSFWTSITGTTSEDVMFVSTFVESKQLFFAPETFSVQLPTATRNTCSLVDYVVKVFIIRCSMRSPCSVPTCDIFCVQYTFALKCNLNLRHLFVSTVYRSSTVNISTCSLGSCDKKL